MCMLFLCLNNLPYFYITIISVRFINRCGLRKVTLGSSVKSVMIVFFLKMSKPCSQAQFKANTPAFHTRSIQTTIA